ncbi:MAG TPA: archaetidylserine decarboxylase [Spongiibacteraceae bacterium]|jgi:phosphatidylserine decarboxylase|nr:archaetidylserine decarboxylase [Spongiibacteraceae bacterium]HUH36679.1 archaetidylserine decarboxylase [Spongiibacteraceae bacterium]
MLNTLFIFLQHLLPHHLLSRLVGALAECRISWIKNPLIRAFIRRYKVDMGEALSPTAESYIHFNAFFTRALAEGARPLAERGVLCPADGAISQLGDIHAGRIVQAKGKQFTTQALLGGDREEAQLFADGRFATIYLSPRDYHRVHMPLAGTLRWMRYIPGRLFSVNQTTVANVDELFAVNERLVCLFDTERGPMAVVLVGAMIVAAIETVWAGQIAPPPRAPVTTDYQQLPAPVSLARGAEMGRFKLGSTVVLLFGQDALRWDPALVAGARVQMGSRLDEPDASSPDLDDVAPRQPSAAVDG